MADGFIRGSEPVSEAGIQFKVDRLIFSFFNFYYSQEVTFMYGK